MDKYINDFTHGIGTILRKLGTISSNMNELHWAIVFICIIGAGVMVMRGKPVEGA